jgi:uncharacterized membrane protein YgcG
MSINALANSTIKNNLQSPAQLRYWRNSILMLGKSTLNDNEVKDTLDKTLVDTTIKRACCLGARTGSDTFRVRVRIPLPPDYAQNIPDINKDFNFIDRIVEVPVSMCDRIMSADGPVAYRKPVKRNDTYSKPCDDFYKLYCANVLAFYIDEFQTKFPGKKIDTDLFAKEYKQECACFNLNSEFPDTVPLSPRCLMYTGCSDIYNDEGIVYLDPKSRKVCPESITICKQIIDLSNVRSGGEINISAELRNQCGNQPGWDGGGGGGGSGGGSGGGGGGGGGKGDNEGSAGTKIFNALTEKYNKVPLWIWLLGGLVLIGIFYIVINSFTKKEKNK